MTILGHQLGVHIGYWLPILKQIIHHPQYDEILLHLKNKYLSASRAIAR